jgi:hypothetical protein
MTANDHPAERHDWWWMVSGFEIGDPVRVQTDACWNGHSLDGETQLPGTALEVAFQRAMLPFCPICDEVGDAAPDLSYDGVTSRRERNT